MKTLSLEEATTLKKQNTALIDVLYKRYMAVALPIAKANPFADVPANLAQTQRVLDKAYQRSARRLELYADLKWPNRRGKKS